MTSGPPAPGGIQKGRIPGKETHMGKKIEKMAAAKNQGAGAPISNKSRIEDTKAEFSKNLQGVAEGFGAVLGLVNWYTDIFPKAMEQLKREGCKYCNHLHCDKCSAEDGEKIRLDGWAWDMGKRNEK